VTTLFNFSGSNGNVPSSLIQGTDGMFSGEAKPANDNVGHQGGRGPSTLSAETTIRETGVTRQNALSRRPGMQPRKRYATTRG